MKHLSCSMRRQTAQFICAAVLILLLPSAQATLTMTLSGTPGSSIIEVSFSGSATVGSTVPVLVSDFGWSFDPSSFDPFPPIINNNGFNFTSGTAQFIDISQNEDYQIDGVWLQGSSNPVSPGNDRFGMLDDTAINFTAGDTYDWSGAATIDLSSLGLTFDSLNVGDTGPIVGLDPPTAGVLEGQLIVAPAPEPSVHLFLCAVAFSMILWQAVSRREALLRKLQQIRCVH
jgi:hypothetical protein